jgi:RNA-directed DNA polymerase
VGWARYYACVGSARIFQSLDNRLYGMLRAWAAYRHPNKGKRWIAHRYWNFTRGHGWIFQPAHGEVRLYRHGQTAIRRHVKVHGVRSPYDGDWVYWSTRLGRHPEVSPRVTRLLKRQRGKCPACGLFFTDSDRMEVDHILPRGRGGTDVNDNLQLLHRHVTTARRRETLAVQVPLTNATSLRSRVRGQLSRTVLEPSRGGDIPA